MNDLNTQLTFNKILGLAGSSPAKAPPESALQVWFNKIADTPLVSFSDGDLSRACRQGLFPEHIVPICVARLAGNPTAGELFNGELAESLKGIPMAYWHTHEREKQMCLSLISRAEEATDDETQSELAYVSSLIQAS